MGMDLKAAGDLVAKTLGSSMNAMSRYGVVVEGAVGSTERLESLTNNVATLFGGQASAQADTYAGSVQQMKNALGDMGEQIGGILIPVFERLEPHLSLAIDFWSKYLGSLEDGKKGVKNQGFEIGELSKQIAYQQKLISGLTASNLFDQRHTKEGLALLERARAQKRDAIEQLKAEKKSIGELIVERFNLNILKQKQLEIDEELQKNPPVTEDATKKIVDQTSAMVDQINIAGALSSALQTTFDPDLGAGEAFKGFVLQLMSAMQGVILASKVVSEALTFTFTGPLGIGAAAAALVGLEAAKAGVRSLEFAETGFDGIVNSPTMFMTGEGNKAERVSVTPLQGPNINGPQGGMTINFNNAIMSSDFTRDQIIPQIQQAVRMNLA